MKSLISPDARIGQNVRIDETARIYPSATIEDDCEIGPYCLIGHPARGAWADLPVTIGPGSLIRSHTVIYQGSAFASRLETGHHVLIREGTQAGHNLRIGSYSDIEGDCVIGDYTRLHGYVHVGRGSRIGHFVWLYSLTTLANDPLPPSDVHAPVVIEDGVVVCIGCTVMSGAILRQGSFIGAHSRVAGDIPPGAVVEGFRGEVLSHVSLLANREHHLQHPWMGHFGHNYPPEAQERLEVLRKAILAGRKAR